MSLVAHRNNPAGTWESVAVNVCISSTIAMLHVISLPERCQVKLLKRRQPSLRSFVAVETILITYMAFGPIVRISKRLRINLSVDIDKRFGRIVENHVLRTWSEEFAWYDAGAAVSSEDAGTIMVHRHQAGGTTPLR